VGVIPTALAVISLITGALLRDHPDVRLEIRSLSFARYRSTLS
jgi:hypothetical protein